VQVGASGIIELQGTCNALDRQCGRVHDRAALQPRVILHAQPGEGSDLTAAKSWLPTRGAVGHADLCRVEPPTARHQEVALLLTLIYAHTARPQSCP